MVLGTPASHAPFTPAPQESRQMDQKCWVMETVWPPPLLLTLKHSKLLKNVLTKTVCNKERKGGWPNLSTELFCSIYMIPQYNEEFSDLVSPRIPSYDLPAGEKHWFLRMEPQTLRDDTQFLKLQIKWKLVHLSSIYLYIPLLVRITLLNSIWSLSPGSRLVSFSCLTTKVGITYSL